jgi:hypothetical protein
MPTLKVNSWLGWRKFTVNSLCPLVMDSPLISHLARLFSCASSLPRMSEPGLRLLKCGDRSRWAPHHIWELGAGSWLWFSAWVWTSLLRGVDHRGADLPEVWTSEMWTSLLILHVLIVSFVRLHAYLSTAQCRFYPRILDSTTAFALCWEADMTFPLIG